MDVSQILMQIATVLLGGLVGCAIAVTLRWVAYLWRNREHRRTDRGSHHPGTGPWASYSATRLRPAPGRTFSGAADPSDGAVAGPLPQREQAEPITAWKFARLHVDAEGVRFRGYGVSIGYDADATAECLHERSTTDGIATRVHATPAPERMCTCGFLRDGHRPQSRRCRPRRGG